MDNGTTLHADGVDMNLALATSIVAAYVSNNSVPRSELPALIAEVRGAVAGTPAQSNPKPGATVQQASPADIKKSITPDALISFIDGKPYKTLKRHLTSHGLTPETYRQRYGLPMDYPSVSPNYSKARSALAKNLQLGVPAGKRAAT